MTTIEQLMDLPYNKIKEIWKTLPDNEKLLLMPDLLKKANEEIEFFQKRLDNMKRTRDLMTSAIEFICLMELEKEKSK